MSEPSVSTAPSAASTSKRGTSWRGADADFFGAASALALDVTPAQLRWLILLRWWAMAGAMVAVLVAAFAELSFASPPGLAAGVAAGVLMNAVLAWRVRRGARGGPEELLVNAMVDTVALTWLLLCSGGLSNPLSALYSFHVVLGALLGGRRGAWQAGGAAVSGIAMLAITEFMGWLPTPPMGHPPLALSVFAALLVASGLTYFGLVVAGRLRREHARMVAESGRASGTLALFLDAIGALNVGLELVGPNGEIVARNDYATRLRTRAPALREGWACPGDRGACGSADGHCQATTQSRATDGHVMCRFGVPHEDGERIVDMMALSPGADSAVRAYLYVDRTEAVVGDQRRVMIERLVTLGRALQDVAHDLNTPLTTMLTLAKDMQGALASAEGLAPAVREDVDESLALVLEEARRCRSLTQTLLSTAHDDKRPGQTGMTALQIVRRAVRLVAHGDDALGFGVAVDEAALDVTLEADGDRVLQVVMNLVDNALAATQGMRGDGQGPRVHITLVSDATHHKLQVLDRGEGLPAHVEAHLFEPFVTTKPPGEGTGLGLYSCAVIAREMGGEMRVRRGERGGTVAELALPHEPPAPSPNAGSATQSGSIPAARGLPILQ